VPVRRNQSGEPVLNRDELKALLAKEFPAAGPSSWLDVDEEPPYRPPPASDTGTLEEDLPPGEEDGP
jgi:hypothetical protein